jgi:hypothetical protein
VTLPQRRFICQVSKLPVAYRCGREESSVYVHMWRRKTLATTVVIGWN